MDFYFLELELLLNEKIGKNRTTARELNRIS